MTPGPTMIPCEGSGTVPLHALCTMCGESLVYLFALYGDGTDLIPPHARRDILTDLKRGDFDEVAP